MNPVILIGAAIGLLIGGFPGLVLGALAGYWLSRSLRVSLLGAGVRAIQRQFLDSTFAVMGAVCKADGQVSADEIRVAEALFERLRLDAEARESAREAFRRGKAADFDVDAEVQRSLAARCARPSATLSPETLRMLWSLRSPPAVRWCGRSRARAWGEKRRQPLLLVLARRPQPHLGPRPARDGRTTASRSVGVRTSCKPAKNANGAAPRLRRTPRLLGLSKVETPAAAGPSECLRLPPDRPPPSRAPSKGAMLPESVQIDGQVAAILQERSGGGGGIGGIGAFGGVDGGGDGG